MATVTQWLSSNGIGSHRISLSDSRGWLKAKVSIAEAEELLKTKFHLYEHDSGASTIAAEHYSVPELVRPHVDFITPTVHFDMKLPTRDEPVERDEPSSFKAEANVKSGNAKSIGLPGNGFLPKTKSAGNLGGVFTDLKNCSQQIVPNCLRALYDLPPLVGGQVSTHASGIVEYTPQAYRQSDLDKFFADYAPGLANKNPKLVSIDGGYAQTTNVSFDYNGESNLDLEYSMALSELSTTLYQVGDPIESGSFSDFLDALDGSFCQYDDPTQDAVYPDNSTAPGAYHGPKDCGGFTATKVISTSYGYNEADLTPLYEHRQCREYAKLGLAGTTFVFSSGDYGVAGNGGQCIDPKTGTYNDGYDGIFNPSFPGGCPYILSVGATQVKNHTSVFDANPEMACEEVIYSGGGFSNVFDMPAYQKGAVSTFLQDHTPPYSSKRYNNTGTTRAFPDVSANGANYRVALEGGYSLVYGTSASAPVFAAILARLNEARARIGKGPVGFVNPTFYENPWLFKDITEGSNPGCGTEGFKAVEGWDPVTGLGTPIYTKMLAYYLALP